MKLPSWLVSGALKVIDKAAHDPKVQAKALEVLRKVAGKKKPEALTRNQLSAVAPEQEAPKP